MIVIYGLQDPRDHLFFYVGQTLDVYKRFIDHIQCSGNNYEKNSKITEMRGQNILPLMIELQRVNSEKDADIREKYWIQHYISLGHPMTNIVYSKFSDKLRLKQVSIKTITEKEKLKITDEKKEAVKRLVDMGMPHRDIARVVGLSGRNYHTYQQMCRDEGILHHKEDSDDE